MACAGLLLAVVAHAPPSLAQEAAPAHEPAAIVTAPHAPGSAITVELRPGDVLVAGTCGIEGAARRGDTTLRLEDPSGDQVAYNDDACGTLGSRLVHRVRGNGGTYRLVAGCYSGGSCGGTIAYSVGDVEPPELPHGVSIELPDDDLPVLRAVASARGVVGVETPGGALIGDAMIEWRPFRELALRLGGTPAGLGGGELGGIGVGSLQLVVALNLGFFEMGVGGGAAVLASRFGDVAGQETGIVVTYARMGMLRSFHFEGRISIAEIHDEAQLVAVDAMVRLPLRGFDVMLRGAAGHDGVALGEAVLVVWLPPSEARELGLRIHAGGGGVFYEPLCRFGSACANARWYLGPMLGIGLEWRPGLAR